MLEPAALTALAASAVAMLSPLFQKAVEKGAEEVGKVSAGALLDKLKQRLSHAGAKEALQDLAAQPTDPATQGALNMQLRKALEVDPGLAEFLKEWVNASSSKVDIAQAVRTEGSHNTTIQIAGSGNSVS